MASVVNEPRGRRRVEFFALDGKRKKVRLGRITGAAARTFAHRLERLVTARRYGDVPDAELRRWLDTLDDRTHAKLAAFDLIAPRLSLTLGEFLDQFMAGCVGMKPSSRAKLEQTKRKLIAVIGASTPLRKLTPQHADAWAAAVAGTVEVSTARIHNGNAKTMFLQAVRRKLIPESPFAHLAAGPTPRELERYVTEDELWRVIDRCPSTEWKLWLALPFYAMLRVPSETQTITWNRVDLGSRRMTVRRPKTERFTNHAWTTVAIPSRLWQLLSDQKASAGDRPTVFRLRRTGYLQKKLAGFVTAAGVAPWPAFFTTVRASGEMFWQGVGIDEGHASRLAGHSTAVSRRHYVRSVPDPVLERMANHGAEAAQKPAQQATEAGGNKGQAAVSASAENSTSQQPDAPYGAQTTGLAVEARGIEPLSQDHANEGLYMLRRSFVVVPRDEDRHPSRGIRRKFLGRPPPSERTAQPAFAASVSRASTLCRGCLN